MSEPASTSPLTWRVFVALLPSLRVERAAIVRTYLVATVSLLLLSAMSVTGAYVVGAAVVDARPPDPVLVLLLAGAVVVRAVLTWVEMDLSHSSAYRVLDRLRMAVFDSFSRSVPRRTREHTGEGASVVMTDMERLEFFYAHTVAQLAAALTTCVVGAVAVSFVSPEVALATVVSGAVVLATAALGAERVRAWSAREAAAQRRLSTQVVDAHTALREVITYHLQDRVRAEIHESGHAVAHAQGRHQVLIAATAAVRQLVVTAAVVVLFLVAVAWVEIDLALVAAVVVLGLSVLSPLADAAEVAARTRPLYTSADRVGAALDRAAEAPDPESPQRVPAGALGLRMEAVDFGYDGRSVLAGFSADIAPGEHVALVGRTGGGKSTVVNLLARLWLPDQGRVQLVGADECVDSAAVPALEHARAVALVDQDATLFRGTVEENLLLGTRGLGRADAQRALELVGANSWIGLDDMLGEEGVRLSGGQRARLCLAVALVRTPRVLLLDEVTANLDAASEREVLAVVHALPCTVVMVTHRAATVAACDRSLRVGG